MFKKQKLILSLKILLIVAAMFFTGSHALAIDTWTPPPLTPPFCDSSIPGCNVPINVGTSPQVKQGNLTINGLFDVVGSAGRWAVSIGRAAYGGISFWGRESNTSYILGTSLKNESNWRFTILGDGKMQWGNGKRLEDVKLYRTAGADGVTNPKLNIDGGLSVSNNITSGGTVIANSFSCASGSSCGLGGGGSGVSKIIPGSGITVSNNGVGEVTISNSAPGTGGVLESLWTKVSATSDNIYKSVGNVGIGNSNPKVSLDLSSATGQSYLRVSSPNSKVAGIQWGRGDANLWYLYRSNAVGVSGADLKLTTGDNRDIMTFGYNGRIIVGTSTSYTELAVNGDLKGSQKIIGGTIMSNSLVLSDTPPTDVLGKKSALYKGVDNKLYFNDKPIGDNNWVVNGEDISNANFGYVGIGTSSPTAKLSVVSNGSDIAQAFSVKGNTGGLFVLNKGFVGIGTTNPSQKLEVVGLIKASGSSGGFVMGPRVGSFGNFQWYNQDGSGVNLYESSSSTDIFSIKKDGSVGVGTVSPAAPLHIKRWAGSSGGLKVEGDSAVTGAPKIELLDTNGGQTSGLLSFDKSKGFSLTGGKLGIVKDGTNFGNSISGAQFRILGESDPNKNFSIGLDTTNNNAIFQNSLLGGDILLNPFSNSFGKVGIGTISPVAKLSIKSVASSLGSTFFTEGNNGPSMNILNNGVVNIPTLNAGFVDANSLTVANQSGLGDSITLKLRKPTGASIQFQSKLNPEDTSWANGFMVDGTQGGNLRFLSPNGGLVVLEADKNEGKIIVSDVCLRDFVDGTGQHVRCLSNATFSGQPVGFKIDGKCGSANNGTFVSYEQVSPTACEIGEIRNLRTEGGKHLWSCVGNTAGTPASCSATQKIGNIRLSWSGGGKLFLASSYPNVTNGELVPMNSMKCPNNKCTITVIPEEGSHITRRQSNLPEGSGSQLDDNSGRNYRYTFTPNINDYSLTITFSLIAGPSVCGPMNGQKYYNRQLGADEACSGGAYSYSGFDQATNISSWTCKGLNSNPVSCSAYKAVSGDGHCNAEDNAAGEYWGNGSLDCRIPIAPGLKYKLMINTDTGWNPYGFDYKDTVMGTSLYKNGLDQSFNAEIVSQDGAPGSQTWVALRCSNGELVRYGGATSNLSCEGAGNVAYFCKFEETVAGKACVPGTAVANYDFNGRNYLQRSAGAPNNYTRIDAAY